MAPAGAVQFIYTHASLRRAADSTESTSQPGVAEHGGHMQGRAASCRQGLYTAPGQGRHPGTKHAGSPALSLREAQGHCDDMIDGVRPLLKTASSQKLVPRQDLSKAPPRTAGRWRRCQDCGPRAGGAQTGRGGPKCPAASILKFSIVFFLKLCFMTLSRGTMEHERGCEALQTVGFILRNALPWLQAGPVALGAGMEGSRPWVWGVSARAGLFLGCLLGSRS